MGRCDGSLRVSPAQESRHNRYNSSRLAFTTGRSARRCIVQERRRGSPTRSSNVGVSDTIRLRNQNAMSVASSSRRLRLRFHPQAYVFLTEALRIAQELLGRDQIEAPDDDSSHISGRELLEGVRLLGLRQFGMMAPIVFKSWGVCSTEDFGHIVFELVERGELRKTERDQLSDFFEIYSFDAAFRDDYRVDTSAAFSS